MSGRSDKVLQEFLSEAQEIVETFSRDLLQLDESRARGSCDPEVLNDAFRAVHSLKGLSGLFGVTRMTNLSHHLENLLDGLRLGRSVLTPVTLDLLFEAVGTYHRLIAQTASPDDSEEVAQQADKLIERLDLVACERARRAEPLPGDYQFDPSMLAVLTEYEEHRLRENIRAGRAIYRVHSVFDIFTIDEGLRQLKSRLKPVAEVITYLPSTNPVGDNQIELDVIMGALKPLEAVRAAVEASGATLSELPRRPGAVAAPLLSPVAGGAPAAALPLGDGTELPGSGLQPPRAEQPALESGEGELTLKSVAQTVRVDIAKLDRLMNIVGDLAIVRAGVHAVVEQLRLQPGLLKLTRGLEREVRAFSRRLDELQEGILEVRMVPLGQVFDKLSRVVRKLSRDAGKEIRLLIAGADTELDKLIVEELSDPLMHVVRNCIDHGIEAPSARALAGKPEAGTVRVSARQRGNHVVIEIEDDGAGLDEARLVHKALELGALTEAQAAELSRAEVMSLIFLPGLSTKEVADEVSGRGVGMDVVKTNISRLSGSIDVSSERGKGTRLSLTLPITLAIIRALIIRTAGRTFAIPLNSVLESLLVSADEVMTIERREAVSLRGQTLPLVAVDQLFELRRPETESHNRGERPPKRYVVVVGLAQHRIGLLVDELVRQQDIVIKSLGKALANLPGIAGATELGGQQTVLVLDVAAIIEEATTLKRVEAA